MPWSFSRHLVPAFLFLVQTWFCLHDKMYEIILNMHEHNIITKVLKTESSTKFKISTWLESKVSSSLHLRNNFVTIRKSSYQRRGVFCPHRGKWNGQLHRKYQRYCETKEEKLNATDLLKRGMLSSQNVFFKTLYIVNYHENEVSRHERSRNI